MQSILKTLPALLDQGDDPEMRRAVTFALWPSAVGEQLKVHSIPISLNDRVLSIVVADANWKGEFEHHAAQIVYRLNASAGRSIVRRIVCVVRSDDFKRSPDSSLTQGAAIQPRVVDPQILSAAARIDDINLRNNFIAAAGNCLSRNAEI